MATGPAADSNNTTVDVLVVNAEGAAAYQFDTSLGGPSAGTASATSQGRVDNNALVISTDEYCGTRNRTTRAHRAGHLQAQLVAEAAT